MKRRLGNIASTQRGEKAWLHFVTEGFRIAANCDERLGRIAADIHDAGGHGRWAVASEHLEQTLRNRVETILIFLRHRVRDFTSGNSELVRIIENDSGLLHSSF